MKFIGTKIPDLVIIEPLVLEDDRGYFFESFKKNEFEKEIGKINFVQENESKSGRGVLRGLHFQRPPFTQAKLVRVVCGEVLDVAVDIRTDSPTFGKHVSVLLSGENKKQFFIPRGFAHGFVVLSDTAVFQYKVDNVYAPDYDDGIIFNDPDLNIDWKIQEDLIKLSEKDKTMLCMKKKEMYKTKEYLK
ncbi:MAG: dTDP-4-dehydrorhamnose 3,5-epimerase [Chlorobi bacterium]|nr:dTDP-4-dehydrorhamnose 3,5-epimerase [Chlorobiota bacterium]